MFGATVSATTVINRLSNFWSCHISRVAKNADSGHKCGKGFGKWAAHTPTQRFCKYCPLPLPPGSMIKKPELNI